MKKPIVPKKYQSAYGETARLRVLATLFNFPEKEFSLSDLAKTAKVAKANLGAILKELENQEIIEVTKLSSIWRIKANQSSWNFIKSKIISNLEFIYLSGLVEFLNEKYKNPLAIILFGSFRKGEDISTSDIDIAIATNETKDYRTERLNELSNFERLIARPIQLHIFNGKTIDINLFNNISNGIVLLGSLQVKPYE